MKRLSSSASLLIGLLLLSFMAITVFFVSQSGGFDIRKRASTGSGTSEITIVPTTNNYSVGDEFTVDVMLATGGKAISGAGFRFFYPFAGTQAEIDVKDADINAPGTQIQSFATTLGSGLYTDVNLVTKLPEKDGTVYIDFRALTTDPAGYTNSSAQKLATITFKANKATNKTIEHDPQRSQITDKVTGLDVLKTIPPFVITTTVDNQAPTVTITGGPAEGSTGNNSSVTFTWSGADAPTRSGNVTVPLVYAYRFDDQQWSDYDSAVTVTRVLTHGTHTFRVRAKDPSGNVSQVVQRTFNLDLTPHLDTITPQTGATGTQVTLTGYNFGTKKDTVRFGSINAEIVSWSDTSIVVRVPPSPGPNVKVIVDGRTSNTLPFNITTMLRGIFGLQGLTQDRGTKKVTLVITQGTTVIERFDNQDASWNATQNAYMVTVGITASFSDARDYAVSIKEASRLRKKFTGIELKNGFTNRLTKTDPADRIQVADFDNNNILELQDFGLLMSNFTATTGLTVPVTAGNAIYDLNGDNTLSINDIGLLLSNLTKLQKRGDDE